MGGDESTNQKHEEKIKTQVNNTLTYAPSPLKPSPRQTD